MGDSTLDPAGPDAAQWERRAKSFGTQAANYARGRPTYPLAAVRFALAGEADRSPRVLDLAAGTGKLTQRLLELGCDVVAVEPLDAMRALIPAEAHPMAGTAEAIPLAAGSVDAVVVGQAWHWFDTVPATAEVVRVLRPGGRVGALWNMYDVSDPLSAAIAKAAGALSSDDEGLEQGPPWPADSGIADPELGAFTGTDVYDRDRLLAYAASHSWVIESDEPDRERIFAGLRDLAPPGEFTVVEKCTVWRGRRS